MINVDYIDFNKLLITLELGSAEEGELRLIDDPELWLDLSLQEYAETASERGFSLEVSVGSTMPEQFMADEAALSAILSALVDNALRYSDPGCVRVECIRKDAMA